VQEVKAERGRVCTDPDGAQSVSNMSMLRVRCLERTKRSGDVGGWIC